jgi:transposase
MKLVDLSGNVAEVLRLGMVEGISVRRIARQLNMARRTVRKMLGRHDAPRGPRGPRLDLDESNIAMVLDDTPFARCVAARAWSGPNEAR